MARSPDELSTLLDEQVQFLRASGLAYDSGILAEAKRLATTVSTLVNTSRTSHALLDQIGALQSIEFLSTTDSLVGRIPKIALVDTEMSTEVGVSFKPKFSGMFARFSPQNWVPFQVWWQKEPIYEVKLEDGSKGTLNRLDLCRYLRSKDGGSHIDAELNAEAYELLSRTAETGIVGVWDGQSVGITVSGAGGENAKPIFEGHLAMMRQIAFEVEQTLIRAGLAQAV